MLDVNDKNCQALDDRLFQFHCQLDTAKHFAEELERLSLIHPDNMNTGEIHQTISSLAEIQAVYFDRLTQQFNQLQAHIETALRGGEPCRQ